MSTFANKLCKVGEAHELTSSKLCKVGEEEEANQTTNFLGSAFN